MYREISVQRYNGLGELLIASEACGGVVESNMVRRTDRYIPATLGGYLQSFAAGTFRIVEEWVK